MKLFITIALIFVAFFATTPLPAQERKADNRNVTAAQQQKRDEPPPVEISAYDNRIVVNNASVGSILEIISVVGIKVKEIEIRYPSGEYPVDIAKGYYIVRLGETVRKIAIR